MSSYRKKSGQSESVWSDRCANPYGRDGHKGVDLRKMTKNMLETFHNSKNNSKSSNKICQTCRKLYYDNQKESQTLPSTGSSESNNFNNSISPSESDGEASPTKKVHLSREEELENLLQGLKDKFTSLPTNDPLRVSILTIAPDSWSSRQIAKEFGTSRRMATKAKKLKNVQGVLSMPISRSGKTLPLATANKVREFYDLDANSRIMANKKDCITVKEDGAKKKVQKRLLMYDVCILHQMFKELYPDHPIGLTKFSELRPKWCILAGSKGTHSVCVCTIYENLNNMLDASNLKELTKNLDYPITDYKDCLKFVLCREPKPSCFVGECTSCPKLEKFSEYITNVFESSGVSDIIFSTWQSTDRCTLKKECLSTEDFVSQLTENLKEFIPHHFIAKSQSKYVTERIENLKHDEVLIQLDFAENYAYIAQDAAQAFHYNNDQCTVVTVCCYYKSGNDTKHSSFIFLSDSTTHDTASVYLVQQNLIPEIKKLCQKLSKVIYVSDGARQHFKNRYQMCNLVKHKEDFGILAEWHCHATAHGKCVCDGIGATFKCEATRASLQAKPNEAILTLSSLYKWGKNKFTNMTICCYTKKQHEKIQRHLSKRFSNAQAVTDISKGHAFIIDLSAKLTVKKFSDAKSDIANVQY